MIFTNFHVALSLGPETVNDSSHSEGDGVVKSWQGMLQKMATKKLANVNPRRHQK